jgi:hypothetical protein
MTVFSTINCVAFALLALSASGTKITFNMKSDGKHWWGGKWKHTPAHGDTRDCVCIKGHAVGKGFGVQCFKGIVGSRTADVPFDFSFPIDITTHGHDGLWVDRFLFEVQGRRYGWGADDTRGWCLSKDKNDSFDKYATHSGCYRTLSFWKGKSIRVTDDVRYRIPAGRTYMYINDMMNVYDEGEKPVCAHLKNKRVGASAMLWMTSGPGRRRVEGSDGEGLEFELSEAPILPVDVVVADDLTRELETVEDSEYDDPDPAGDNPTQAHNHADALVLERLRQEIKKLVRDNTDVTDAQIDQILNSAMLDVEHILEREEHEGEVVLEPEGIEGEIVAADGSVAINATPEASDGSTATNSKNDRGVQGRLQDLEESP